MLKGRNIRKDQNHSSRLTNGYYVHRLLFLIKINRRPANPAKNQLPAESVLGAEDFGSGSISVEEALRGKGTSIGASQTTQPERKGNPKGEIQYVQRSLSAVL